MPAAKRPETLEEAIRYSLNIRARQRNECRRTIEMLQNAMRFCDDDAALKRMADEVIRLTAIAAVANADILFADMRLDQTIAAR
jgi:hypothetical protein